MLNNDIKKNIKAKAFTILKYTTIPKPSEVKSDFELPQPMFPVFDEHIGIGSIFPSFIKCGCKE